MMCGIVRSHRLTVIGALSSARAFWTYESEPWTFGLSWQGATLLRSAREDTKCSPVQMIFR